MEHALIFKGFLYSKLINIGFATESSEFFIQLFRSDEILIEKKVSCSENGETLNAFLGHKIEIEGFFREHVFCYRHIKTILNKNYNINPHAFRILFLKKIFILNWKKHLEH